MFNFIFQIIFTILLLNSFKGLSLTCDSPDNLIVIHDCLNCSYFWEVSLNKCLSSCLNSNEFYNTKNMKC